MCFNNCALRESSILYGIYVRWRESMPGTGTQLGTGKPRNFPPPRNFCKHDGIHELHMKSYFSRLRYLYVNFFSRQRFRIRAASYWIKLLTNQYALLTKNPSTEPETSFVALAMRWNQPRLHGGLVDLSPQTKLQTPPNWNMKRNKSMQLLSTLIIKPPLHKRNDPHTNAKPPYWRLSGDGPEWNHPFHESSLVVVNVTSQSRNPYTINQGCK